jgi:hypothetical protein
MAKKTTKFANIALFFAFGSCLVIANAMKNSSTWKAQLTNREVLIS